jgi:hypothetical protein
MILMGNNPYRARDSGLPGDDAQLLEPIDVVIHGAYRTTHVPRDVSHTGSKVVCSAVLANRLEDALLRWRESHGIHGITASDAASSRTGSAGPCVRGGSRV